MPGGIKTKVSVARTTYPTTEAFIDQDTLKSRSDCQLVDSLFKFRLMKKQCEVEERAVRDELISRKRGRKPGDPTDFIGTKNKAVIVYVGRTTLSRSRVKQFITNEQYQACLIEKGPYEQIMLYPLGPND